MIRHPLGETPPHLIRGNKLSRVPKHFAIITAAPKQETANTIEGRFFTALRVDVQPDGLYSPRQKPITLADPGQFWEMLEIWAEDCTTLILVSPTLADDIRLSAGIPWLISHGWNMQRLNIRDTNFSGAFTRDKTRITLVDLKAWLPHTLQRIVAMTGSTRAVLHDPLASDTEWRAEVNQRVQDIALIWADFANWIKTDDLGNWKPSGAGMAWANWRHKHYTHKILMHGRPDLMELERTAAGTGRAEAWRWGKYQDVQFDEWDMTLAYPTLARDLDIPTQFSGEVIQPPMSIITKPQPARRYLVEASVATDVPILGVRGQHGWLWPVGQFRGVWWDHELALAIKHGALVTLEHVWFYRAAPALYDWARWILKYLSNTDGAAIATRQAAAKHWARALIGRFGTRYDDWQLEGPTPKQGFYTTVLHDIDLDQTMPAMVLQDKLYLSKGKVWGHDAVPQVMGAIMAECRIALWHIMEQAGLNHVVYTDTDALVVDEIGSEAIRAAVARANPLGLRIKHTYKDLEILGPRALISDRNRKISGVPLKAEQKAGHKFFGGIADGIAGSFFHGQIDRIQLDARWWQLGLVDNRRLHVADGFTNPITLKLEETAHQIG